MSLPRCVGGTVTRLAVLALLSLTQVSALAAIDTPIACTGTSGTGADFNTARFCGDSGSVNHLYVQGGKEQTVQKRLSAANQSATPPVCSGNACTSYALYDSQYNAVREYYYEQEYFEGSIALTQVGVAWKQVSSQSSDQIQLTSGGTKTTQVVRIKHFWQLPHVWDMTAYSKLDYDDLRNNNFNPFSADPAINDFYEVLYTNPMKNPDALTQTYSNIQNQNVYEWFAGDLVPMKSCAYVVNMNVDSTYKRNYSIQRIMMSIQYDANTFQKIVKIVPDADFKATQALANSNDDIPKTSLEINFYWRWAAFYYFQEGILHIKQDSNWLTTYNTLDKLKAADACQRTTPIFAPGAATLVHYRQTITGVGTQTLVSHEFVYEGLYMVWSGSTSKIIRLEGKPGGTGTAAFVQVDFFTMSMVTNFSGITGSTAILQIASMEYYGLMVNIGQKNFIEIEPDKIMVKDATTGLLTFTDAGAAVHTYSGTLKYDGTSATTLADTTKTLGIRVRTDATTVCTGTGSTGFKFLQTKGEMHMHRPIWMICQGSDTASQTTMHRVTTVLNKFMQIPSGHPMVAFTKIYDFKQQVLRFHMLATQPGNTDTTSTGPPVCTRAAPCTTNKSTSNYQTWQSTEAVVIGLRQEDEVLRWPLATCGDSVVNATSFEECDYAKGVDTPINLLNAYPSGDANYGYGPSTMNTYNYPAPDRGTYTACNDGLKSNTWPYTQTCQGTTPSSGAIWEANYMKNQREDLTITNAVPSGSALPNFSTTWPPQKLERWSGEKTIWFDPVTKSYYNCDILCKKVKINLCGDGIPSNGRVPGPNYDATVTTGVQYWVKNPTNQQVGVDLVSTDAGYEACDDGNNRDGDGCSKDCKTVETGYECPRWGVACNLQCGNGHRQWYKDASGNVKSTQYSRVSRVVGTVGTVINEIEECDLGYVSAQNTDPSSANYKKIACNADCKVTDKNLWFCEWIEDKDASNVVIGYHSKCSYLCGNQKVDRLDNLANPNLPATTPITSWMSIGETCDKGVQQWSGMEYSNGYKYALKTGFQSSQDFTGEYYTPTTQANLGTQVFGKSAPAPAVYHKGGAGLNLPYINYLASLGDTFWSATCPATGAVYSTHSTTCWFTNPQDNNGWLVGCSEFCQVIRDTSVTPLAPGETLPASATATQTAVPSNPATATVTGGAALNTLTYNTGGTTFKCPTEWTGVNTCTDRCGDGIYDGLIPWGNFGRFRSTKPYPTGVNGYTPRNKLFGFDYAMRMPIEQCDTGQNLSSTDQLGYNEDGVGMNPSTHGCDRMCKIVPGWECSIFFYKMLRREAWDYQGLTVPDNISGLSAKGLGIEEPLFRSECWQKTDGTNDPLPSGSASINGPWRRRLMPEDFDPHGRWLHHLPLRYNFFKMPTNTHEFYNDALKLSPLLGLNGQVRLLEAPATMCTTPETDACCGVIFGYENTKAVNNDYTYSTSRGKPSPANDLALGQMTMTNDLEGKMKNTFGMYLVRNKNLNQIEIYGYDTSLGVGVTKLKLLWTSAAETSVQFLGAHEFYWWPYKQFIMAKLSDGSSFKFFRLQKGFQAKYGASPADDSSSAFADKIQNNGYGLFNVNGRVTVPPVFYEKLIYMYTTMTKNYHGYLRAYQYNPGRMEMDLVCQVDLGLEPSDLYDNYSLVSVGADGVVFSFAGAFTSAKLYKCDGNSNVETWPVTITGTAVTLNYSGCISPSATPSRTLPAPMYCAFGGLDASLILRQPREDPETYVSGTTASIWGWLSDSKYFMRFTFSGTVLTVAQSIALPYWLNLVGTNYSTNTPGFLLAANMDVGKQFLAVLSPMQCNAKYSATVKNPITSPSVYYYFLAAVPMQDKYNCYGDLASDGFDDWSTTNCQPDMDTSVIPNVQKIDPAIPIANAPKNKLWINPVPYSETKGWTCVNLPNTLFEPGTEAWQDNAAAWSTDAAGKHVWNET